ncbi:hypothetical protein JVU11DRAFT_1101 [Chiua virens]|nr:hypothetical protein JVU11DRAFT_1101 [Chiua virens]
MSSDLSRSIPVLAPLASVMTSMVILFANGVHHGRFLVLMESIQMEHTRFDTPMDMSTTSVLRSL